MIEYAKHYLNAGLSVLPANPQLKYAALQHWKPFQHRLPTDAEVRAWFGNGHTGVCIVAGAVSGNLEMMDFDLEAELFEPWCDRIKQADPNLLDRLVIETSQSGGRHVIYRCDSDVSGNLKLAQRKVCVPSGDEIIIGSKSHKPRKDKDGQWHVVLTLIETRGQGGLFLCAPTPGYTLLQGELTSLPTLTTDQRELLLEAAWSLTELIPDPVEVPQGTASSALRPGDDYNARGDIRPLLQAHGWTCVKGGDNEYWRRPGKTLGWSATLKDGVFFVWSSNAYPFEPEKPYSAFSVYSHLEHHGDFSAAAAELAKQGFGENAAPTPAADVNLSALLPASDTIADEEDDEPVSLTELIANFQGLNTPIIHGLLREGETMNIIASPKVGKSWMVDLLAISLASGLDWLGYKIDTGRVLLIDNELHINTTTYRMIQVAKALGMKTPLFSGHIDVKSLRGKLKDLHRLANTFTKLKPGRYKVIVIDAFYRTLPLGVDENDNGAIANLYNLLDLHAARLKCAFVLIHHASKGNQSNKSVTDVGAGAGSQSRAVDTHLVIRPHQDKDTFVVDAAVRSWAPIEPFVIRKQHPLFVIDPKADPEDLQGVEKKREPKTKLTLQDFVDTCVGAYDPCSARMIAYQAEQLYDLTEYKTKEMLEAAQERKLLVRMKIGSKMKYIKNRDGFGNEKGQWAAALLIHNPTLDVQEIADQVGVSRQYVYQLRQQISCQQTVNWEKVT